MDWSHDEDDLVQLVDDPARDDKRAPGWKVLVVDDEPEVHAVTRMALDDFRFQGRGLDFLLADSATEARELLLEHDDIVLVLLDVVMEREDAGLRLVRWIREELDNSRVRIVLRTGQPGSAPEREVILSYDINDYKEKTELTAQKLTTTVIASIRSYQAIAEVERLNRGLEEQVAARTAELVKSNADLKRTLEQLEAGERAGKRVQFKLLPEQSLRFGDYCFSHHLMPSDYMSGDFVDYFAIDSQRVGFYIADVSGHGVASAFVTVYLKRFMSTAMESLRRGRNERVLDPAGLLAELNAELLAEDLGKYMTIFYAVLDLQSHSLLYANAGAFPWPLLLAGEQRQFLELPSTPVGLFDFSEYHNQHLDLPPACRFLCFSDGLLEALGNRQVNDTLQRVSENLHSDINTIDQALKALGVDGLQRLPDDLTVLMFTRGT